jgi:hypothetical protein
VIELVMDNPESEQKEGGWNGKSRIGDETFNMGMSR